MSISMYEASVPCFLKMLGSLNTILVKAKEYEQEKSIPKDVFPNLRLFPDMWPLYRQVQIATDNAKGSVARLAGIENMTFDDNEKTLDELIIRVKKTINFVESIRPEQINSSENKDIIFFIKEHRMQFKGMSYLLDFSLPNLYFHITTAYSILRHNGVNIGKKDYLGG